MTKFSFEHEFKHATPGDIFDIYFDPEHIVEQDQLAEIDRRELVEASDSPDERVVVYKVFPRRLIPAAVKHFAKNGPLHYIEHVTWRKADDVMEFSIKPSVMGDRAHIVASYRLAPVGPGRVKRTYDGKADVDVPLFGRRIEKAIVDELARSMERTAKCTQEWLDRRQQRGGTGSTAHSS
jgi:hypothetical protein